MRKLAVLLTLLVALVPATGFASPGDQVRGMYVEARSAQVFIGGCVMSSEADTMGREAVLAWRVDEGTAQGLEVTGLRLLAVIAGEQNLGIDALAPRRTVLYVDGGDAAQQQALVTSFAARHGELFGEVARVISSPVEFRATDNGFHVGVGDAVRVVAERLPMRHHDLVSCGEQTWYDPFVAVDNAVTAVAREHEYQGSDLGIRWRDPNGQSAYFGAFGF